MKVSGVSKSCQIVRLHRFDMPSRSTFIIFQGEYKGPKNKILIRARQNPSSPFFTRTVLFYLVVLVTRKRSSIVYSCNACDTIIIYNILSLLDTGEKRGLTSNCVKSYKAKEFVVPSTLTRCITASCSFFSMYQVLFSTQHIK